MWFITTHFKYCFANLLSYCHLVCVVSQGHRGRGHAEQAPQDVVTRQVGPPAVLIEENEGNNVRGDLHQPGQEEDEVCVSAELRHVEGEAEVERAEGEPGERDDDGVAEHHAGAEQVQEGSPRSCVRRGAEAGDDDLALDAVDPHDPLERGATLVLAAGGQQPLGRLRDEEDEGGEGEDAEGHEQLQVERVRDGIGYPRQGEVTCNMGTVN